MEELKGITSTFAVDISISVTRIRVASNTMDENDGNLINRNQAIAITRKEEGEETYMEVVTGWGRYQGRVSNRLNSHNPANLKYLIRRSFQESP